MKRNLGAGTLSPSGISLLFGDQRKKRILALLRQRGPMTRADLSRATGIAKSSISLLVDQLAQARSVQIIRATSSNRSKSVRGRPGELVEIDPSSGAAIGIEFAVGKVRAVIGDLSHEILAEIELSVPANYGSDIALQTAESMVSHLLSITRITPSRILGIGIGIPTAIYEDIEVSESFNPTLLTPDLSNQLSELTGFSTSIENSANLAAYAELLWGAGLGETDFLFFKTDNLVGGAIVMNHEVITGSMGGVGEFGHLILNPNGNVCRCGQRGCLDTYSSIQAMTSSASIALGLEVDNVQLKALIEKNDSVAVRILDDAAEKLGEAAATLSRVINPDCVIFSGEALELHPDFLRKISEGFDARTMSINAHVRIIRGNLGNQAAALGGVALILGQVK